MSARPHKSNSRYRTVTPGIYAIVNKINGKMYIGSAVNFQKREKEHFLALRKGLHPNRYLQFSFNKYNGAFEFKILEIVNNLELLIEREQHFMDILKTVVPSGYNLKDQADSNLGSRHTEAAKEKNRQKHLGKKLTDETKLKMSLVRKGRKQDKDWIDKRTKSLKLTLAKRREKELFLITDVIEIGSA